MTIIDGLKVLKTRDIRFSRALYLECSGQVICDKVTGKPMQGDVIAGNTIFRFKDGRLHGGVDTENEAVRPAVELNGHWEFWEQGKIHVPANLDAVDDDSVDMPAVRSDYGRWREYWHEGELFLIESDGLDIVSYPNGG